MLPSYISKQKLNIFLTLFQFLRSTMWARHEPAGMKHKKTDHWTKMKHKSTTFKVEMPSATIVEKSNFRFIPNY